MTIFSEAFTAEGWDALELDDDELIIEHTFVPAELPGDKPEAFAESDIEVMDTPVEARVVFKVWMVVREPTEEEFEAAKAGFRGEVEGEFSGTAARYWQWGLEQGENVGDGHTAEEALGGRLPHPMLYHRDEYTGPRYFGPSFDFRSRTDFSPSDAEAIIESGSFAELAGAEMPEVDVNHSEHGTRYEIHYWPDSVEF